MRVAWRTVGTTLERVAAEATREVDVLDGLRRIGIDEINHRKGRQRYLTVVVDHHSGRLVRDAPGRTARPCLPSSISWAKSGELKGARFAVWKNPENLTDRQAAKLAKIQHTNAKLYRAYLLKEQLRQIYRLPAAAAERLLDRWLAWARRCRLPSFVKLARTITEQLDGITARSPTAS